MPEPDRVHRQWTTENGLPSNVLSSVAQGEDGYLWIGTYDGLVRFDGHRFSVFRAAQVPVLGSSRILDVARAGRDLWILTAVGTVTLYRDGRFQPAAGIGPRDGEARLLKYQAGELWVVAEHALFRARDGRLERSLRLPDDRDLTGLAHDHEGKQWLTSTYGIARVEGDELVWRRSSRILGAAAHGEGMLFFRQDDVPLAWRDDRWASYVEPVAPGVVFLGTASVGELPWGGSLVLNDGRYFLVGDDTLELLESDAPAGVLKASFASARSGERWLAVGGKVFRDGEKVFELGVESAIQSLIADREGTLWLATTNDGLHALSIPSVTVLDRSSGLTEDNVYAVFEDRTGAIWIGTHGAGAWRLAAGGLRRIPAEGTQEQTFPRAFSEDAAGTIWVGLSGRMSGGVYRFEDSRLAPVTGARGGVGGEPPNGSVNALIHDPRGRLWAGTEAGLYVLDSDFGPTAWRRVGKGELPHQQVRSLALSPAGELWVATASGIARRGPDRWRIIDHRSGLPSNLVRALYFDDRGILWIGTEDAGLARLDPGGSDLDGAVDLATFDTRNGLFANGVHAILEDGLGHLWMSCNRGLFFVDREALEEVAAGEARRVVSIAFDERDGLRNREANGGTPNAALRSRDGRLWFATQQGIAVVDPASLFGARRQATRVRLETLSAGETVVELSTGDRDSRSVVLAAPDRTFSIDFTALPLGGAHRARFRYRLDGYDSGWTEAGDRRRAFFTRVPPGDYTFRVEVRGAGPGGHPAAAALKVAIEPVFHETWWFRGLALAAVVGLAVGLVQLRNARSNARQKARREELERTVAERTEVIARQAEKLRELDRLKSELFTDVSHEFRTPLTLTIGPLQDLLDGARGPLTKDIEDDVELALRNSRRVLDLIHQILDVARLEAGHVHLQAQQRDLLPFLVDRLQGFVPLGERGGVSSHFESSVYGPEADNLEIWFDPEMLGRVLDNLLSNAFNLTPEGGSVTLQVAADDPDWVQIAVHDTGPGIPADSLESIFVRFQQAAGEEPSPAGQAVPRRWSGTGIGLAQAKKIVELHRGTLHVESVEGEGASFFVSLRRGNDHFEADELAGESQNPESDVTRIATAARRETSNERQDSPAAIDEVSPAPEGDHALVLIVDDNPEIRSYVRRTLTGDYRVLEASDGREALGIAQQRLPDLILSDVMMPGMDGFDLARALAADPELDFVPIVLLTAKGSMGSKIEGLELGVDDYLTKPFDSRELLTRVRNLIEGRRRLLDTAPFSGKLSLHAARIEVLPADQSFLDRVRDLAEANLEDCDFGVESLADALGCDRSYLLRKLRELIDETPSEVLRRLRLERAEQLLKARVGTVAEVAYQVGFRSVSHFSHCFRARYGSTPSSYARSTS